RRTKRLWRWARRNPLPAASTSLAAVALAALLVLALAFGLRERGLARELRQALYSSRYQLAESYLDRALPDSAQAEPDDRLLWLARGLAACPERADDLRQTIRLNLAAWRRAVHALRAPLPHSSVVRCVAFGPGGRQLLTGCDDGSTRLWSTLDGEPLG